MANRSGLRKITKSVRGRKGSVRRSYWVRAKEGAGRAAGHVKQFAKDHTGKIIAGAAIATGIYLHKRKVNAAKNAEMSAAMNLADYRVDARNSLRAIGLDPRRPPNHTPIVRGERTIVNPAVTEQRERSRSANASAEAQRFFARIGKARPLQLGSGETAKPKRASRKKK